MKQSRRASHIEAWANIAVGVGLAFASNFVLFPLVGIPPPSVAANAELTFYFTLISWARSYSMRRLFEHLRVKGIMP